MKCNLEKICDYVNDKIFVSELNLQTYISTENMLPNKQGITKSSALPKTKQTQAFIKGDVLISNIRPYFKKIWLANFNGGCSNDVLVLRAKPNIDKTFLYYALSNDSFFDYATATAKGTKMPRGDKIAILKYQIPILPIEEQKRIAAILSALDDKIEINRRINENLEQQAQALFKSWFVDFEPWGGQMPEDWRIVKLGEVCRCELGGTPSRNKPEYWNGDIPWINSGSVNLFRIIKPTEKITELGLRKSATKLLPAKTTVVAITGATLGQVSLLEIESCANQSVVGIISNNDVPYEYIYPFMNTNIQKLISHKTGGAQQHINKQNIESLSFLLPTASILKKYIAVSGYIYEMISKNCFESEGISEIRNSLLSRLMSGEIDVSEIKFDSCM